MSNISILEKMIPGLIDITLEAGRAISGYYEKGEVATRLKADQSPVTDADIAAHHIIAQGLGKLGPWPVVSEEASETQKQVTSPYHWLVDPLDGTKEFLARTDEFTVNIALIHATRPVLGFVYAPVFDTLYYANAHGAAFKQVGSKPPVQLQTRAFDPQSFVLVVSRSHHSAKFDGFLQKWPGCTLRGVGSSLKFCQLAEGTADLYIRKKGSSEWDTAAAQCVLEGAGGKVLALPGGTPMVYNKATLENPSFFASADHQLDMHLFNLDRL